VVAVGEEKEEWPAIGNLGEERRGISGGSRQEQEGEREEKAWDSVVQ